MQPHGNQTVQKKHLSLSVHGSSHDTRRWGYSILRGRTIPSYIPHKPKQNNKRFDPFPVCEGVMKGSSPLLTFLKGEGVNEGVKSAFVKGSSPLLTFQYLFPDKTDFSLQMFVPFNTQFYPLDHTAYRTVVIDPELRAIEVKSGLDPFSLFDPFSFCPFCCFAFCD